MRQLQRREASVVHVVAWHTEANLKHEARHSSLLHILLA